MIIGYIIDPYNPEFSNTDIIANLINKNSLKDALLEAEDLSGRFVIIWGDEKNICLFHDATGFREIYYYLSSSTIFCGSTPDIINKYAGIEQDKDESITEFINSAEYRSSGFWIGNGTPLKHVYHLQPNFYLDLLNKGCLRYWPYENRKEIDIKEAARTMAQILKGTMFCAAKRYVLHQALTAGYDSRLLLAAVKDHTDQIKFSVNKVQHTTNRVADIKIPRLVARKFNLDFEVVEIDNERVEADFREVYFRNNVFSRELHLPVFYDAHRKGFDNTYWVTGSFGNEVLRIIFPLKKRNITSLDIAKRFNYSKYSYAVHAIETWMNEAREVYNKYGYNLVNMFYWEQFTGNWETLGGSEGSIIREEIRPFNCRKLITTYISLKDKYRYKDHPVGHLMTIKYLWKDLLKVPVAAYINLPSYWIKRISRFIGLEITADRIYNSIKNRILYN